MHPKLWNKYTLSFFLLLISPTIYTGAHQKRRWESTKKTKTLAVNRHGKGNQRKRKNKSRWRSSKRPSKCAIRIKYKRGKSSGVGNINQSVHLVGNHMADQHANCANLLILSNRVQLIPLAAFISPSHTGGKKVKKERKGFLMTFYSSPQVCLAFFLVFWTAESNPGDEWGGHEGLR